MHNKKLIRDQLLKIYGQDGHEVWPRLERKIEEFIARVSPSSKDRLILTQKDVVLITYADQFQEEDLSPIQTLSKFLENHLEGTINRVHILPFYPFSSDDGFSVIDFRQVNHDYGNWKDIALLASNYGLMFDAVVNHISRKSDWFKAYLDGTPPYTEYFFEVAPETDLSSVFRPRALPLLTKVKTKSGEKYVWTTFSEDQIDLNYANPEVLLEVIDLLLFYIEHGASLIRLDAIGFIWKEIGTTSLNLEQAHGIVKILRAVLNEAAPYTGLITETNVPHQENIRYFGDPALGGNYGEGNAEGDEAHLVYQFSLAPLILHSFLTADITSLTQWSRSLSAPYANTAFFNFIASHDGIGVTPAKGILKDREIEALIELTKAHGGQVSYKTNSDGTKSAYELNITLYDALNNPSDPDPEVDIRRFIASQAILLSLAGVPGIYVHSLFGSRNCHACVEHTGRARSINREKFSYEHMETILANPDNVQARIFSRYKHLIRIRREHSAFHPGGSQTILETNKRVFSVLRSDLSAQNHVFCLVNVSPENQQVKINLSPSKFTANISFHDLITGKDCSPREGALEVILDGYQVMWIANKTKTKI